MKRRPTQRARGPRTALFAGQAPQKERDRRAGFTPPKWLFSWLCVLSVSWVSLVPPAAGIPAKSAETFP